MRPDHIKRVKSQEVEANRASAFDRKQRWKELPGNRYTLDELRQMVGEFGEFVVRRPKRRIMFID